MTEATDPGPVRKAVAVARRAIQQGDANLAVYAVRDLALTKQLGLDDLAREMYRSPYIPVSEATDLLNRIEAAMCVEGGEEG